MHRCLRASFFLPACARHDVRAGLYVPLSVLVVQVDDRQIGVDFDQPSSVLGQLDNPPITEVAIGLDAKVQRLIEKATLLSRQ